MGKPKPLTKKQKSKREEIVKAIKHKPGLNPYAVANAQVKRMGKNRRR